VPASLLEEIELQSKSPKFFYRKTYATYILVALNLIIFVWMLSHGLAGADKLYRAAAVAVPQELTSIDWWKLLAANFVHRNISHLALNLLFLCLIGPFVEFVMGKKKYVLTYLLAGFGALLMDLVYAKVFNLYVPALRVDVPQLVGGASSSVLGIVGARGAIFLVKWIKERNGLARNHFIFLLVLVLLQAGADLTDLNVAFGAHVTGAIIGFFLGLVLGNTPFDLSGANPVSLVGATKTSA
jgi:rhomboid protease GluP